MRATAADPSGSSAARTDSGAAEYTHVTTNVYVVLKNQPSRVFPRRGARGRGRKTAVQRSFEEGSGLLLGTCLSVGSMVCTLLFYNSM